EPDLNEFLDRLDAAELHEVLQDDVLAIEVIADHAEGVAGLAVQDEGLRADFPRLNPSPDRPGMLRWHEEVHVVLKERAKTYLLSRRRLEHNGNIDPVRAQRLDHLGRITWFDANRAGGIFSSKLPQDTRQQVLARCHARTNTQPAVSPVLEPLQCITRILHFPQDLFHVMQQLLAGLRQVRALSDAIEKTHAHLNFERLDRMAHRRLRQKKLLCGCRETAEACQR